MNLKNRNKLKLEENLKFNFQSSTWTVEAFRTRFPCPEMWKIFSFLKKIVIWAQYGQLSISQRIRLDWLLHAGFGEISFLKWRVQSIQILGF